MHANTALQLAQATAAHARNRRSPLPLRVAMLAQDDAEPSSDDGAPTDVMIYRQPASDVPVPSTWRPSPEMQDTPSAEAEPSTITGPLPLPSLPEVTRRSASTSARRQGRRAGWVVGGIVACTLVASLLLCVSPGAADMPPQLITSR